MEILSGLLVLNDSMDDLVLIAAVTVVSLSCYALLQYRQENRRNARRVERRWWMRPWLKRRELGQPNTVLKLYKEILDDGDLSEFKATLRMPPETYDHLLSILRPALLRKNTNWRKSISPEERLALTMRYLAFGEGFRTLSHSFRIGLSTTRLIVQQTCQAIISLMQEDFLRTPQTCDEWMDVAKKFNDRWQFPHLLGAADGKHVRIVAPVNSGSLYYNYKDFFSIILMAVVNGDYEFIFVDLGAEGKASDGGVWAKCAFKECLDDPSNPLNIPAPSNIDGMEGLVPYFLVADDAFKMGPNLLKPFPSTGLTRKQRIFNYRLSRARRIVENAFGILTSRFRILRRAIEVHPMTAQKIVMACCILHNFLRRYAKTSYMPAVAIDTEKDDGDVVGGAWRDEEMLQPLNRVPQKNASEYSKELRRRLADYFLTGEGEIEWQYTQAFK